MTSAKASAVSHIHSARLLLQSISSCSIATVDFSGRPHTSYAPFIEQGGRFYCYASDLSKHTAHLLEGKLACLLFIEDEADCKNIFARKRLTVPCAVKEISRTSQEFELLSEQMLATLGDTVSILKQLTDFHLFEFKPMSANIVTGFGDAHSIDDLGKLCLNSSP